MRALVSDAGVALADSAAVLAASHQRVTRVSVLDSLFNPLPGLVFTGSAGYALEGSVSQDLARSVRRTCRLLLANPDGVWTPTGEGSAFYWDKHIKVERGVVVGGVEYYAPCGVFLIDTPEVDGRSETLALSGADRMDRATRSEFTEPIEFPSNQGVGSVIRVILEAAGVGSTNWQINDEGSLLGASRVYEQGDERLPAALTLANDFGLEVFADAGGFMVVQPIRDPLSLSDAWAFEAGEGATHTGISKRWSRDRFYNHVLVTGEAAAIADPARGEASVTDPSNPLRTTGPMGDRLFKYTSGMITSDAQAAKVATRLLWQKAIIEEEIRVEHVPHPGLEANDAIRIIDQPTATDDRYAIASAELPLAGGPATLTVRKIRVLS